MTDKKTLSGKYAAYPEYKDSGVEWLGEIPSHWSCIKLKYIADLKGEKIEPNSILKYVGMENVESWSGTYIAREDVKPEGVSTSFYKGDVLFGKLRPYLAKSWLADFSGVCSSEFLVLRSKKINSKFLNYYSLTEDFISQVNSSTYGSKMPRASWDFISLMGVPVPPVVDSEKIANFLDHETAKIDTLIDKQQQLIQLLKEKRQAVISHAVTKGLNPNAPMRDSGVEWLGEVPEHWEISRVGFHAEKIGSGKTPRGGSEIYQVEGVLFLRSQNIYDEGLRISNKESVYISDAIHEEMSSTKVLPGDVLLNITGASIGRSCLVPADFFEANVNQHVCIVRLPVSLKEFLSYTFKSSLIKSQIDSCQTGSNREGLNFEQVSKLVICIPPEPERVDIVKFIRLSINKHNEMEKKAKAAIALMQERRTALISAAVTGKIDVRHHASHPAGDLQSSKSTVHGDS